MDLENRLIPTRARPLLEARSSLSLDSMGSEIGTSPGCLPVRPGSLEHLDELDLPRSPKEDEQCSQ